MDLDSRRRIQRVLDILVNHELTGDQSGSHNYEASNISAPLLRVERRLTHPRSETCEQSTEARFLAERDQSLNHGSLRSMALVDLRKKGIRGLREHTVSAEQAEGGPCLRD